MPYKHSPNQESVATDPVQHCGAERPDGAFASEARAGRACWQRIGHDLTVAPWCRRRQRWSNLLFTTSGRLRPTVFAAVAQFETEVRGERQRAGIEAAKVANGGSCPWGGRARGTKVRATAEEAAIKAMSEAGTPVAEIARVVGLGRQTVYRVLGRWERRPAT